MSEEKYHVEYLKECPFCGKKDKLYIGKYKQPIGFGLYKENWNVGCEYCNVKMTLSADALMGDKSYDESEAILAWNRRNGEGVVEIYTDYNALQRMIDDGTIIRKDGE